MQALVLSNNANLMGETAAVLFEKGFHVIGLNTVPAAEKFLRKSQVDVLIMEERVAGKLTHGMSLLAEYRNSLAETILVTERQGPDVDELFDLLPSLNCILGGQIDPTVVGRIAFGMISGSRVSADIESSYRDGSGLLTPGPAKPQEETQCRQDAALRRVATRAAAYAAAKSGRVAEPENAAAFEVDGVDQNVGVEPNRDQPGADARALTQDAVFQSSLRHLDKASVAGTSEASSGRRFALSPEKLRGHASPASSSEAEQIPAQAQG